MESRSLIALESNHRFAIGAGREVEASWHVRLLRSTIDAFQHFRRHHPQLDLDEAPDSMKRDLGFLDGRDPYREENLMR